MMRSRTWKRVLAAVCAGVAAVSMAACGGGTNSTAKDGVIIRSHYQQCYEFNFAGVVEL